MQGREESTASPLATLFLQEDLNFLVTNRIPRRWATLAMGWFSRLENRHLTRLSIATWQLFADDLRLDEAARTDFKSLHECFVRKLRPGARPIAADPDVLVSPCDAIVGAHGRIDGTRVIQAKGFPYSIVDLLGSEELAGRHRDGWFVTLRLKSNFYHRFHAPADARIPRVTYISGDTWNVNPIALERVERLFCKNERAVVELALPDDRELLTIVAVASILVASIQLHCLPEVLDLRYRGPNVMLPKDACVTKGDELGYFQSGSTLIVFAKGPFTLAEDVVQGATIRVGEPLFCRTRFR
jgi:phosphatidylserine decarboxylase